MGQWLDQHGTSIHATRGGLYKPSRDVVSTRPNNLFYLHILGWSDDTHKLDGAAMDLPPIDVSAFAGPRRTTASADD